MLNLQHFTSCLSYIVCIIDFILNINFSVYFCFMFCWQNHTAVRCNLIDTFLGIALLYNQIQQAIVIS